MSRPKKTEIDVKMEKARAANRQINYFVMRKVWRMIRPRGSEGIYENLGIRRERYTRAIDTGRIRLTKTELLRLVDQTGISAEIFEGARHFCIEGISDEEWISFFELRTLKRNNGYKPDIKKYKKANDTISKMIERCNRNDLIGNKDFWALCYYVEHLNRFAGNLFATKAVESIKTIEQISFEEFEAYDTQQLITIRSILAQQLEKVDIIINYWNMKATK